MDKKENELLPCPFCGGKAEMQYTQRQYDFYDAVECQNCGASIASALFYKTDCKERWNRRVTK